MKNVLAATTLAATLIVGSALPSFAATSSLGSYSSDATTSFSSGVVKGSFTDYYTFTLTTMATLAEGSITASFTKASQFIKNFTIALYSGTVGSGTLIASATTNQASTGSTTKGSEGTGIDGYNLGTGSYYLQVTGTTGSASYGGSLAISAVPLPSTVALFGVALAGLGVAGAMRRKSAASVA